MRSMIAVMMCSATSVAVACGTSLHDADVHRQDVMSMWPSDQVAKLVDEEGESLAKWQNNGQAMAK